MEEVLLFGKKDPSLDYITRVGVYGIIFNNVLIIQSEGGGCFLPGGGLEGNESHAECLYREMIEETGFQVKMGPYIGQAKKFHVAKGTIPTLNEAHFYIATLGQKIQDASEVGEEPVWLEINKAINLLFHEHQVWGVKKALSIVGS